MKSRLSFSLILMIGLWGCGFKKSSDPQHSQQPQANELGNGLDMKDVSFGTAWFLGTQPIHYCYVRQNEFEVTPAIIETTLDAVIAQWISYIESHRINSSVVSLNELNLDTNFVRSPSCTGHEDVVIYLGTPLKNVVSAQQAEGVVNPYAFAHRESYNDKLGWGKGLIWVSLSPTADPLWSLDGALHGVLLHEFGHIFGSGHIIGTAMDETSTLVDLWALQGRGSIDHHEEEKINALADLKSIDRESELALCESCAFHFDGMLGSDEIAEEKVFEMLVGRKSNGPVTASLSQPALVEGSDRGQVTLSIADASSKANFDFSTDRKTALCGGVQEVFLRVINHLDEGGALSGRNAVHYSITSMGQIKNASGNNVSVSFERNMASQQKNDLNYWTRRSMIQLSAILNGQRTLIFHQ